jgi:hypothetical protein
MRMPYGLVLNKVSKYLFVLFILTLGACKGYDEVNFQTDKCKQPPSATILARQIPNTLRFEFSLDNVVNTLEQAPIYVTWQIDYPAITGDIRDKSFNAARLSYQFDRPVDQVKIKATLYNRCLMEKSIETTINVK